MVRENERKIFLWCVVLAIPSMMCFAGAAFSQSPSLVDQSVFNAVSEAGVTVKTEKNVTVDGRSHVSSASVSYLTSICCFKQSSASGEYCFNDDYAFELGNGPNANTWIVKRLETELDSISDEEHAGRSGFGLHSLVGNRCLAPSLFKVPVFSNVWLLLDRITKEPGFREIARSDELIHFSFNCKELDTTLVVKMQMSSGLPHVIDAVYTGKNGELRSSRTDCQWSHLNGQLNNAFFRCVMPGDVIDISKAKLLTDYRVVYDHSPLHREYFTLGHYGLSEPHKKNGSWVSLVVVAVGIFVFGAGCLRLKSQRKPKQ